MSWTFLEEITVKARKEHSCFCCGETILKGTKYVKRTGVDDEIMTMKMHPECEKATSKLSPDEWESFSEGELERPRDWAVQALRTDR